MKTHWGLLAILASGVNALWPLPASYSHGSAVVWIDPAVVAATVAILISVVLLAAWLPARRAARIEPTLALRGQ